MVASVHTSSVRVWHIRHWHRDLEDTLALKPSMHATLTGASAFDHDVSKCRWNTEAALA